MMWRTGLALMVVMAATACSALKPEDRFTAQRADFSRLPAWREDDHTAALDVFLASCEILVKSPRPPTEKSQLIISGKVWGRLCKEGQNAKGSAQRARIFFEQNFMPFAVGNNKNEEGLFTGYYEPLLYGALQQDDFFRYPVYGKPKDLTDEPYLTRQEIETAGLAGKAPVLVWVNDPVMLFFMQVQGSGRVKLTNGENLRLGFAARNNHPYVSIGKLLREEKLLADDHLDFFGIRRWLYAHPDQAPAILWRNTSYIFFQKLDGNAPKGAAGAELAAGRSLAVDKRYIPYGLPLYLQTTLPARGNNEPQPFNRLMVAQDTGSAILGPVRGDIFFGYGPEAEYSAGKMKSSGRYTLLMPKAIESQLRP